MKLCELPETISGKIHRAELRRREADGIAAQARRSGDFWEDDVPRP